MAVQRDGIKIGTVSGGIVNFGGAVIISPISVTKESAGSGVDNTGAIVTTKSGLSITNQRTITDLLNLLKTML